MRVALIYALVDTRRTFRLELEADRRNLVNETANVQDTSAEVDRVLSDYAQLIKDPGQLQKRVDDIKPGFYAFSGTAWGAASSSGILAYMKTDEENRFADAYFSVEAYQPISRQALLDFTAVNSFFDSRPSLSPQDAVEGEQRLRTFRFDLRIMAHVDREFMDDLNAALASQ